MSDMKRWPVTRGGHNWKKHGLRGALVARWERKCPISLRKRFHLDLFCLGTQSTAKLTSPLFTNFCTVSHILQKNVFHISHNMPKFLGFEKPFQTSPDPQQHKKDLEKTSSTRIRGQRKEVYKHSTTCLQFCNLAHEILLWRVWLNISANICRKGRSISNNICKAQLSISNVSAKWTSAGRQPTSARGSADTSAANICHSSTHGGKNFYGNFRHA